ncbi:hypothetical protein FRB94_002343 [Tulasnella sp. JGI-2019a]|nr:hypothetical protein FRB94_002343 [Tulasnella sp. JGI-2019a]
MPRLPVDDPTNESVARRWAKQARKFAKRWGRSAMRSRSVTMPRNLPDLPIRLRPWFILFTSLIMIILGLLGFTNIAQNWPLNDKILHFVCFAAATGVFYFIFDVEEDARRIWFWRYFGMIATVLICFFFGGIVSEIVQSLLPYKTFQYGDVLANLLGSGIGLYVSFYFERYYRRRREISRLYRPLAEETDEGGYSDDEDTSRLPSGPTYSSPHGAPSASTPRTESMQVKSNSEDGSGRPVMSPLHVKNVWDDRLDVFDIGDDDDEDIRAPVGQRSKV